VVGEFWYSLDIEKENDYRQQGDQWIYTYLTASPTLLTYRHVGAHPQNSTAIRRPAAASKARRPRPRDRVGVCLPTLQSERAWYVDSAMDQACSSEWERSKCSSRLHRSRQAHGDQHHHSAHRPGRRVSNAAVVQINQRKRRRSTGTQPSRPHTEREHSEGRQDQDVKSAGALCSSRGSPMPLPFVSCIYRVRNRDTWTVLRAVLRAWWWLVQREVSEVLWGRPWIFVCRESRLNRTQAQSMYCMAPAGHSSMWRLDGVKREGRLASRFEWGAPLDRGRCHVMREAMAMALAMNNGPTIMIQWPGTIVWEGWSCNT